MDIAYVPKDDRKTGGGLDRDVDAVLAHNEFHHLHLGPRDGRRFVSRTRELLVGAFQPGDAYLIGVYPHGSWGQRDLPERIVPNWLEARLLDCLEGAIGVSQDYFERDRWALMKAGVTVLAEIDGRVVVSPGQTVAGTPMDVTQQTNALMWELTYLREQGLAERLRRRGSDPSLYWAPAVEQDVLGVRSQHGFVGLGRLS